MTPSQRRQLIEKRQQGTLTEEENRQYLELLRTDSSFYDDVKIHTLLTEVVREETDQEMWEAVSKARAKDRKRSIVPVSIRQYPYVYAMVACMALLIVGLWIYNIVILPDTTPQLVKSEKRNVYLVADSSRLGYDDYAGSIWLQWKRNEQLQVSQAYTFCHDTLTVFLKNTQDTVVWQTVGLRFNSKQQILFISRNNKSLLPLQECTKEPQSISP